MSEKKLLPKIILPGKNRKQHETGDWRDGKYVGKNILPGKNRKQHETVPVKVV